MKRSEMIKHIARAMQLPTISKEPSLYWLKYAEIALDTVEQCRMLPPRFKREATENEIKNDDERVFFDNDLEKEFIFINEWEPEDETNK